MAGFIFRIEPAIGIARVGNSAEYYIGPEMAAGEPQPDSRLIGGLPIKPGTDGDTITSADLRDGNGALKRQAARFRVYRFPEDAGRTYPSGVAAQEVSIGSRVDGRTVKDIVWTVHLANKKAACWQLNEEKGMRAYDAGNTPMLRNADFPDQGAKADDPQRLRKLIIDAGPRTVASRAAGGAPAKAAFASTSTPAYWDASHGYRPLPDYPMTFPGAAFEKDILYTPADGPDDMPSDNDDPKDSGRPIDTLGHIEAEKSGRLLVLGGYGRATRFCYKDDCNTLSSDVNNDCWFDDTSDGPVTASIIFDDDSSVEVANAWVMTTDPSYAPQIRNAVTLWDDIYNTWVRDFDLQPEIFGGGSYSKDFKPAFDRDIQPILLAAGLQQWVTNLPAEAINAHRQLATKITADTDPSDWFDVEAVVRDPNAAAPPDCDNADAGSTNRGAPLMPLSLGDAGFAFLTFTKTQYHFLKQWDEGNYVATADAPLNEAEKLTRNVLANCLGGRFNPGIDMTFICRDVNLYKAEWRHPAVGPFRVNMKPIDYAKLQKSDPSAPVLTVGYTPLRKNTQVEPGDLCKFMAIPWHTDYNSCATHTPSPNPGGPIAVGDSIFDGRNLTTFWSWPAQRPVAVYTFDDVAANEGKLPHRQRFSLRGTGTPTKPKSEDNPFPAENVGRYQDRIQALVGWDKVGVILQGPAIDGYNVSDGNADYYLEVASRLRGPSDAVDPWPVTVTQDVRREPDT